MVKEKHLKIEIGSKQPEGYAVRASSSAGEAKGLLKVPFKGKALDRRLKSISDIDSATGKPTVTEKKLRKVGSRLFRSLFNDEIGSLLSATYSMTKNGLVLRLQSGDPLIARFPWELLYDGSLFQVASGKLQLTRYIPLPQRIPSVAVSGPLRVLVVVSRPLDQYQLDPEGETKAILKGLKDLETKGRVVIDILRPPTHKALIEWLSDPDFQCHVLHFDGHGTFQNGEGYVIFEDEFGRSDEISASTLANTLCGSGLKLVVLSACLSGVSSSTDMFRGVSQALILAGIPAVVAMQFSVPISSTINFFRQVYNSLSKADTVLRAVTQGRKTLYPLGTWYFPVLYERSTSTKLILRGRPRKKVARKWIPPQHNLPIEVHPYIVGRHFELMELSRNFALPSVIIVLWGAGGIGKTALAVAAARRNDWRFPDGIFYVEVRGGKTLDMILNEIASLLGIRAPVEFEKKKAMILGRIADRECLLVIDNFEDVETDEEILAFLSDFKPPTKVLLTSRHHPLRTGWLSVPVRHMPIHDSVYLFLRSAEDVSRRFTSEKDLETIEEICEYLGGYPLAIKVAARMTFSTSLNKILEGLRERLPKGVEAALSLSFESMKQEDRTLLKRLSIYEGPFGEGAIRAVSQPKGKRDWIRNWKERKDELVRRSFLSLYRKWFFLHPVIRRFTYNKLEDKKRWHLIGAEYFLSRGYGISAFDHLFRAGNWKKAIVLAIRMSTKVVTAIELAGEIAVRLEVASTLAREKMRDVKVEVVALRCLADLYNVTGRLDKARLRYKEAVTKHRALLERDKENITYRMNFFRTLNNFGSMLATIGRFDEARSNYEEALAVRRAVLEKDKDNVNYQMNLAISLNNLGFLFVETKRYDEALPLLEEAFAMRRALLEKDKESVRYQEHFKTTVGNLCVLKCQRAELALKSRDFQAFEQYFSACVMSLMHDWSFHNHIVNITIKQIKRLKQEGDTKTALSFCEYLIRGWQKLRLDEKIPQFIKCIQKEKKRMEKK